MVLKQAPERDRGESSCISVLALAPRSESERSSKSYQGLQELGTTHSDLRSSVARGVTFFGSKTFVIGFLGCASALHAAGDR